MFSALILPLEPTASATKHRRLLRMFRLLLPLLMPLLRRWICQTRYEIALPEVPRAPEGDQLGIFGCSFYGMKVRERTAPNT